MPFNFGNIADIINKDKFFEKLFRVSFSTTYYSSEFYFLKIALFANIITLKVYCNL